eukprot:scaffold254004_cov29-Tisochrysis_lutea.AAC.2
MEYFVSSTVELSEIDPLKATSSDLGSGFVSIEDASHGTCPGSVHVGQVVVVIAAAAAAAAVAVAAVPASTTASASARAAAVTRAAASPARDACVAALTAAAAGLVARSHCVPVRRAQPLLEVRYKADGHPIACTNIAPHRPSAVVCGSTVPAPTLHIGGARHRRPKWRRGPHIRMVSAQLFASSGVVHPEFIPEVQWGLSGKDGPRLTGRCGHVDPCHKPSVGMSGITCAAIRSMRVAAAARRVAVVEGGREEIAGLGETVINIGVAVQTRP